MCLAAGAAKTWEYKPSVSILGDSYSTYEGFIKPATNEMWYFANESGDRTDVRDVTQTWWWLFIKENGFRLEFEQPQRAPTPGQSVVLYQGDVVLGGGTIVAVE